MKQRYPNFLLLILIIIIIFLAACQVPEQSSISQGINDTQEDEVQVINQIHWWNDSVFYLVFIRSFYDSNGDGIGDINGLIERLDYLNDGNPDSNSDLGVTALWLMPIQPATSYHGYDVTNYYEINPDYGTLDDFRRLIDEAHHRGIRIIIDLVLNHTSNQHPFFIASQNPDSEYRNYYIWSDTDPGYLGPWGETVWHPGELEGYYYGIFNAEMPDLNYTNPAVTTEMEEVSRFWLQDVGVDGFRVDAARHLVEEGQIQANSQETHAWYADYTSFLHEINPDVMTVGEVWDSTVLAAEYTQNNEFNLVFDFDLADALINGAASRNVSRINHVLETDLPLFSNGLTMATFLTNHDMTRAMTEVSGDREKMKAAATLLLTLPGTPFIYYGEEIGMTGEKPDENLRTPMQWSSEIYAGFSLSTPWEDVHEDYPSTNVEIETNDTQSLLTFYRNLIHLRLQHSALQTGSFWSIETGSNRVFAAIRSDSEEAILILINLGIDPISDLTLTLQTGPLEGNYHLHSLIGDLHLTDLSTNAAGGMDAYQPISILPGNSIGIFLLQPIQ